MWSCCRCSQFERLADLDAEDVRRVAASLLIEHPALTALNARSPTLLHIHKTFCSRRLATTLSVVFFGCFSQYESESIVIV